MTAKSIIQVDVADQAFKNFKDLFDKYQAQLAKMPAGWNKVNAASAAGNKVIAQISSDLDKAAAHLKKLDDYQRLLNKHAKDGDVTFKSIGKSTASIQKAVTATTGMLLKWAGLGGILGGLMGVGGLFGFANIASSASDLRRQSMGMGVTPGQLQSAQAHYGKYMDVNSVLGGINEAQTDSNKKYILSLLGVSQSDMQNKSSAQLLPDLIPKLVDAFKRYNGNRNVLESTGITSIADYNTLRELSKLSPEEMKSTADKYREDASKMDVPDAKLRALQEFDEQLDAAAKLIKSTFMEALAPLAPNLEKLSHSIADAVQTFLKNPNLGKQIEDFGTGIKDAAVYLNSGEFKSNVKDFMITLGGLGAAFKAILHPYDTVIKRKVNEDLAKWNQEDLARRNKGMVSGKLRVVGTSSSGPLTADEIKMKAPTGDPMQKTIDNIRNGVPASPVSWNGGALPGYQVPLPVRVTINNNTGGSAVASAASLAHQ